jgi:hypothetical protein
MSERRARRRSAKRGRGESRPGPVAAVSTAAPSHLPVLILGSLPFIAVLVLLAPYLWPLDRAPAVEVSDIYRYHAPMTELLASGLRRDGELPRWNVQDFAGMPTLGDPQTEMYNPLHWLLFLHPSLHAFGLLIVAYTLVGAVGFLVFARTAGLAIAGAAAGAVAFASGGALLLRLVVAGHTVFAPFFLVPLLLAALHRSAHAPRAATIAGAAALIGLLIVSLHPQVLFYSGCLIAAVCVATVRHAPHRARALATVAAAFALGLALAAVHVLPMIAFAPEFSRGQPALFDPGEWADDTPFDSSRLTDIVSGRGAAAATGVSWETHCYVGGLGLVLVLTGLFSWPRRHEQRRLAWLYGALAVILLLFGLGPAAGVAPWIERLPGFNYFRITERAFVLLGLPVAVLVALGVEALVRAPVERCRIAAGAASVLVLVLLVATGADAVHVAALVIGIAGGAAMIGASDLRSGVGALLVVAALALDNGAIIAPYVDTQPEATIGTLADGVALPDSAATRIAELARSDEAPGIPELAVRRHGLETLAGFNPLIPWRFLLYAAYATGLDPLGNHFDMAVPLLKREQPVLFDLLGVTHVLHPPSETTERWRWERSADAFPRAYLVPGPTVEAEGEGDAMLPREVEALERLAALDPHAHVLLHGRAAEAALAAIGAVPGAELEAYRPVPLAARTANRLALDVHLDRPGILVLNEPFFPGWQARDGAHAVPLLRANVLFRALALEPGDHHLTLEFAPVAWRIGWWISVVAVALTLALAASPVNRAFARSPTGRPPR